MRKVSLLTLLTVSLVSSMASAETMSGNTNHSNHNITPSLMNMENPLYMPKEGTFYSKTNFNYTPVKNYGDNYSLTEEFGYGLSQYVALVGAIGYGWMSDETNMFGEDRGLSNLSLAAQIRTIANQDVVWDLFAGVNIDVADNGVKQYSIDLPIDDLGKKDTAAFLNTRFGINLSSDFILAVNAGYSYDFADKENFDDRKLGDTSYWNAGLEGQLVFSDDWSMNMAYKYKKFTSNDVEKAEKSDVVLAGNWQATDSSLVTLYVDYDITSKGDRLKANDVAFVGEDGDDNRWSYGARVGMQF